MKNQQDLQRLITNFEKYCNFLIDNPRIISRGNIAEYYCGLLFDLKLSNKPTDPYDAIDRQGKRVEIKQRDYSGRVLGQVRIGKLRAPE